MTCRSSHYDALIFGNGPAALVCAIQLARFGKTEMVIPPSARMNPKSWGETLAPRGEFLLSQLGLAEECLTEQFSTRNMLACWLKPEQQKIDLAFDPHGRMWHLNRQFFDTKLLECAIRLGVSVLDGPYEPVEFRRGNSQWEVIYTSNGQMHSAHAEFVIDSTGKSYCIARLLGVKRVCRDKLAALFGVCDHSGDFLPLLIEPVEDGWWYSFTFPDGKLVIALVVDPKLVRVSSGTRRSVWNAMLQDAPHTRSRVTRYVDPLDVVSAESSRLDRMTGEGWIAIGDAAMSFDPLSSHGLSSAIEQAIQCAQVLQASGRKAALRDFERTRKELFERYLTQRTALYQSVRRFPKSPFWKCRSALANQVS